MKPSIATALLLAIIMLSACATSPNKHASIPGVMLKEMYITAGTGISKRSLYLLTRFANTRAIKVHKAANLQLLITRDSLTRRQINNTNDADVKSYQLSLNTSYQVLCNKQTITSLSFTSTDVASINESGIAIHNGATVTHVQHLYQKAYAKLLHKLNTIVSTNHNCR